jgi:hypothetical protein
VASGELLSLFFRSKIESGFALGVVGETGGHLEGVRYSGLGPPGVGLPVPVISKTSRGGIGGEKGDKQTCIVLGRDVHKL